MTYDIKSMQYISLRKTKLNIEISHKAYGIWMMEYDICIMAYGTWNIYDKRQMNMEDDI